MEGRFFDVRYKITIPLSLIHFLVPLLLVFFSFNLCIIAISPLYGLYQYIDRHSEELWITKWNLVEFMAGIFFGASLRFVWGVLMWVV